MKFVLYKARPAWELPSYSAASIQTEAYLRLAEAEVSAVECSNSGVSPTGHLPALETADGDILGTAGGEFENAQHLVQTLKARGVDLDTKLGRSQQAQAAAFVALIKNAMEPATLYTSWCETESFSKHMRPVAGAGLAVPLNYLTTWRQRRAHLTAYADRSSAEIYAHAVECYTTLVAQLKGVSGGYLLGSNPSTADAMLYGHLALHLSSPVTAPELRSAVESEGVLRSYAERLAKVFEQPLPPPPEPPTSAEWTERAEAAAKGRPQPRKELSEKEKERQRRNWWWLLAAAGIFTSYVVFSGQVIQFGVEYDEDEEEEDEE